MPKNITEYDILLSCPGDVVDELETINEAVEKFNATGPKLHSIRLNVKHWSKDSYTQSGGNAQKLLNKQFIEDCDAAIAIFWTRFGTPTDTYGSGTEEEIEIMLEAKKQVFMYFCEKPIEPKLLLDDGSRIQYEKVQDFRTRYQNENKGIYYTFNTTEDFSEKLLAHISQHFLTVKKMEEISSQRKPKLILKGINDGVLSEDVNCEKFDFNGKISTDKLITEIKEMYEEINNIVVPVENTSTLNTAFANIYHKVEIDEKKKNYLKKIAKSLEVEIRDSFFSLGNLKITNNTFTMVTNSVSYHGTDEETKKHSLINALYSKIKDANKCIPIEDAFKDYHSIKLAISNAGSLVDEDIEVSLKVPTNSIVLTNNLPYPDSFSIYDLPDDISFEDLFIIETTSNYNSHYSSMKKEPPYIPPFNSASLLYNSGSSRTDEDAYYEELDSIFNYKIYKQENTIILKVGIDYIKHHTAVAFPTVLFVTEDLTEIQYTITSKNMEKPATDTIKVITRNPNDTEK